MFNLTYFFIEFILEVSEVKFFIRNFNLKSKLILLFSIVISLES